MDLGHGFLPRLRRGNHHALDRAATNNLTLYGAQDVELPWVLVEGAWAVEDPPLLRQLGERGTKLLLDTEGWRYREPETFKSTKFSEAPYAPAEPLLLGTRDLDEYVEADLRFQAARGASAYLIPGFIPRGARDDPTRMALRAINVAEGATLPAKPMVAFVGVHTSNLDAGRSLLAQLPKFVSAVYVQFTPVNPMGDSVAKLVSLARLLSEYRSEGFEVIGGRLGAAGNLLRALGISATDAGLGDGETFDRGGKVRTGSTGEKKSGPRPSGGRIYVPEIGRSIWGVEWKRLTAIDSIRGYLVCNRPCCLFRATGETTLSRSREHSLHCRVEEAKRLHDLPGSMRADRAFDDLRAARSMLATFNSALREEGERPMKGEYADNLIAAMARVLGRPEAA